MKTFALIGAAGYIAPKHMQAIKDIGGSLVAACDPHDSVGVLDSYFPGCLYFREFERFDRYLSSNPVNYLVVCSPNYLHDAHCRFGLRIGATVICEKPLVLYERNLDQLEELQRKFSRRIYTILQSRLIPEIADLYDKTRGPYYFNADLEYCTPRGNWFLYSWKGVPELSGGLATNIGIHMFDLLLWLFGPAAEVIIEHKSDRIVEGVLQCDHGQTTFFLSIDSPGVRRLTVGDGPVIEFSNKFKNLHTKSYFEIIEGRGFGIEDTRPAIRLCEHIRKIRPYEKKLLCA